MANNFQLVSKQYQTTINVSKFIVTAMIVNDFKLFKLNRCWGFGGVVEHDAVDVLDFVDDAVGGGGDGLGGQDGDLSRHKVGGGHGTQSNGVIVGALVTHNADTAHVGQRGKVLAGALGHGQLAYFLAPDGVGILDDSDLFGGHIADDADGQARAGEWLTGDQVLGQAQLAASLTDLVLEQVAQRLDNLLEVHIIRQAADVVVALDGRALAAEAALDHVGIDGALGQEVHGADLLGFILEHADELLADDLALALRGALPCQLLVEAVAGIDADKVDVKLAAFAEHLADLFALVLAQQAVVNEHAGQLLTDGLGQHGSTDAGVDTARQGAEHLAVTDLLAQGLDAVLHEGVHLPGAGTAADVVHKVVQDLGAVLGVQDLRVELHAVQAAGLILGSGHRAVGGVSHNFKAGGGRLDIVVMAHPADVFVRQAGEQRAGGVQVDHGLAVLALRGFADLAAQHVHHQLAAVADTQDRHAPSVDLGVDGRRIRQVGTVGAAGKDDALGVLGLDLGQVGAVRIDLAINVTFTDAAGNQLVILAAEIQYDNGFLLHGCTPFSMYVIFVVCHIFISIPHCTPKNNIKTGAHLTVSA